MTVMAENMPQSYMFSFVREILWVTKIECTVAM